MQDIGVNSLNALTFVKNYINKVDVDPLSPEFPSRFISVLEKKSKGNYLYLYKLSRHIYPLDGDYRSLALSVKLYSIAKNGSYSKDMRGSQITEASKKLFKDGQRYPYIPALFSSTCISVPKYMDEVRSSIRDSTLLKWYKLLLNHERTKPINPRNRR